ncbi:MAG: FtsH protease activity modulator HflK [Dehalococcoidia bacterium]|nr:FtsH protease activity modulator HflK [Dehalococcoidia bacterium]
MDREPGEPQQIDWNELWRKLTKKGGGGSQKPHLGSKPLIIAITIVVVIWLATGIYTVGPAEQGIIKQFGREISKSSAGLHYHLPQPIQSVTVVDMSTIRRSEIGFKGSVDIPSEALMLTGDENIVDIHAVVQYKVKDASQYLFKVKNVESALKAAAEVALRGVVGQNDIDYIMTEGRADVQEKTRIFLQQLMDNYQSGLTITEVKLQEVYAPVEVRDAFDEVVRAREDKDKKLREAEGYTADVIPRARGEKEQQIQAGLAYKQERIIRAQGDAEKFLSVMEEYKKYPDVTRKRLYLETMEDILPNVEKIIIDPQTSGNMLPFLPLRGLPNTISPEVSEVPGEK